MKRIRTTGKRIRIQILLFSSANENKFFPDFFACYLYSVGLFTSVFKDNNLLRGHNIVEIKDFSLYLVDRSIRICTNKKTDPDLEQGCFVTNSTSAGVQASFWMLLEKKQFADLFVARSISMLSVFRTIYKYVASLPASKNIHIMNLYYWR